MAKFKAEKLSDDSLDQVTGGTNKEMMQLQSAMGASNLKEIKDGLLDLGIKAKLSSRDENEYTDLRSGKPLTQEEVLKKV